MDEKILALTLYKQSPKSYRFLSKMFVLPSKGTLTNFLNEIDFEAGMSEEIFNSLQQKVLKMPSTERYVTLMWDEMSILEKITVSTKIPTTY